MRGIRTEELLHLRAILKLTGTGPLKIRDQVIANDQTHYLISLIASTELAAVNLDP